MGKIIGTVLLVLSLAIGPASVRAAEIYFGTQAETIDLNSPLEVGVFLSTEGQTVSAVEGQVTFPSDLLKIVDIRDGNSAVNLWIEAPHEDQGRIVFSGVTPGGFQRADALLFTIVFETNTQAGQAALSTEGVRVLLNDGLGTATAQHTSDLHLEIKPGGATDAVRPMGDTTPPEPFAPTIVQDPSLAGGAQMLVFATQDKDSGIEGYDIKETWPWWQPSGWFRKAAWVKAESPYRLQDQSLRSFITVKAYDKAGNARLETLTPTHGIFRNVFGEKWGILLLLAGLALLSVLSLLGGRICRRHKRRI